VNTVMPVENWVFEGPEGVETINTPVSPFHVNTADAMTVAIKSGHGDWHSAHRICSGWPERQAR
jgi:hypothetical protein